MNQPFHTVLGAGGAVGQAVIRELQRRGLPVKAVTRSRKLENIHQMQADLLDPLQAEKAVAGSSHVYVCVGLPYKTDIWGRDWEILMGNLIEACARHRARLIFLDNIYMYAAPLPVPFDENSPQDPPSEKGKARKRTADMLLQAMAANKLSALIARSADFYGAGAVNSSFYISFLERMLKGKNPQTLGKADVRHTYSDVNDNGRALVELALCESCYGQIWHLPVGPPTTTNEMLARFNQVMQKDFQLSVLPAGLRKILSLFITTLREASEMLYQFEEEYVMSDEKFRRQFPDFETKSYEKGVAEMVAWFQPAEKVKSNL